MIILFFINIQTKTSKREKFTQENQKKIKNALILVTTAHPDDRIFKKREIFNFSETSSMIRHFLSFEPSTQVQPTQRQEILLPQGKAFVEAMSVVQKAFPNRPFSTLQDIIAVPEAFEMLYKLASNRDIQELEKKLLLRPLNLRSK
mgnify:FL=1